MTSCFTHVLSAAAAFGLLLAVPASAEPVTPNHLDCHFAANATEMTCPSIAAVAEGRAATQQSVPVERGTPEWNQACAAKFKSFNPATGTYTSFSGQERPCI